MSVHRYFSFALIAAVAGTAACLTPSPRSTKTPVPAQKLLVPVTVPTPPSPAPITSPVNANPSSYFNNQYHFTCTIPDGFIVTHESEGPGEIMTLVTQTMSSDTTANLSVRAAHLGRMTLEQYMDFRITRELQGATNVTHWDKFPASYGAYSGFEIVVERQYASGPFKSRLFGFSYGTNVFIINYSASADQFDLNQKVLDQFLESLSFSPS